MSESRELLTMRAFAWERAKAELKCYLQTFWSTFSSDDTIYSSDFDLADKKISKFIEDFENTCR